MYKTKKGKPVRARAIKPGFAEVFRFKCHTNISSDKENYYLKFKRIRIRSENPNVIDMSHDYGESEDSW